VAFGALANQQQVAALDGAAEIGDRHFMTAPSAPDIGQQALADLGRDRFPALASWWGEIWKRFNTHGLFLEQF
jgi:hypothetical protein